METKLQQLEKKISEKKEDYRKKLFPKDKNFKLDDFEKIKMFYDLKSSYLSINKFKRIKMTNNEINKEVEKFLKFSEYQARSLKAILKKADSKIIEDYRNGNLSLPEALREMKRGENIECKVCHQVKNGHEFPPNRHICSACVNEYYKHRKLSFRENGKIHDKERKLIVEKIARLKNTITEQSSAIIEAKNIVNGIQFQIDSYSKKIKAIAKCLTQNEREIISSLLDSKCIEFQKIKKELMEE